jgi:hypothetical protein
MKTVTITDYDSIKDSVSLHGLKVLTFVFFFLQNGSLSSDPLKFTFSKRYRNGTSFNRAKFIVTVLSSHLSFVNVEFETSLTVDKFKIIIGS